MKHTCLAIFLIMLLVTGCATVRPDAQSKLKEARRYGLPVNSVQQVDPGVAGVLNILPGIGNIYLAVNATEKDDKTVNWILFPVNFICWPFSILWGVPQAAIDAETINNEATADYYSNDKQGQAEFQKAKSSSGK